MKKLLLLMFSTTLIFMFSVSAIAQKGKTVKVTNNNQLIEAYEDPSVESIKLAGGYYDYINYDAPPGTILMKQTGNNGSRGDCNYIITPQVQCWIPSGTNGGTASANATGDPSCPPANSGAWSLEAYDPPGPPVPSITWTNPPATMYDEDFTVNIPGKYSLRYTWNATTYVQADWYFFTQPSADITVDDGCVDDDPQTTVYVDFDWGDYEYFGHNINWKLNGAPITGPSDDGSFDITGQPCGLYTVSVYIEQYYNAEYGPCSPVTIEKDFFLYDTPGIDPGPADKTCGLFYTLKPSSTASCWGPTGPTTSWEKFSGPGTVHFSGDYVVVGECGDYEFKVTITNGLCFASDIVKIGFEETPVTTITGLTEVFACSSTKYIAEDGRSPGCNSSELEYDWKIPSGPGTITHGQKEKEVTVEWDNSSTTTTLSVDVCVKGTKLDPCCDYEDIEIDKVAPTFAGQVRYWNEFETYMPTPFPTSINGTYPPDYFYVTLYEGTTAMTEIETVIVEPRLMPDLVELLSYFEFTLPIGIVKNGEQYDCDAEFLLRIWDGGLSYDPNYPANGFNEYLGAAYTYNNWGGVNATDALALQKMAAGVDINDPTLGNYSWVGPYALSPHYGDYSEGIANVNNSTTPTITTLDPLIAIYRSVGLIPKYPSAQAGIMYSPNFEVTGRMVDLLPKTTWSNYFDYVANVDDIPFTHSGADYQYYDQAEDHKYTSGVIPWKGETNYMNIYYECLGDINASHVPTSGGFKAEPTMELIYEGKLAASQGEELTIPFSIDNDAQIGALTLNLNYRKDLIEVIGTNYEKDFFNINHEEGYVRIGWFSLDAMNVRADENIAILKLRVLADIEQDTRLFELDAMTELADASANRIDGVNFKTFSITTDKDAVIIGSELTANNYPNPFKNRTIITYMLPESGKVQVVVYNKMGQIVSTIVDQSQDAGTQIVEFNHSDLNAGVYYYRITLKGESSIHSVSKSMIVVK